jgi:hypothetical protein
MMCMRRRPTALAPLPILTGGIALAQRAYAPGPENIALPEGWESRFIRCGTPNKPDRRIIRNF